MTTTKDLPRLVIGAISTALDVIATDLEYLDDDDEDDDVSHEDDDDNLLVGNQSSIFRDTRRRQ